MTEVRSLPVRAVAGIGHVEGGLPPLQHGADARRGLRRLRVAPGGRSGADVEVIHTDACVGAVQAVFLREVPPSAVHADDRAIATQDCDVVLEHVQKKDSLPLPRKAENSAQARHKPLVQPHLFSIALCV